MPRVDVANNPLYKYAFSLTHSDLRRSLFWVLESIESTTREVNVVYPTSSRRNFSLLQPPSSGCPTSSRIKRKLSPFDTNIEKIVPEPSRSDYPQSAGVLSATPSDHDRQRNSSGELPSPPLYPIFSISRSVSLPIKVKQVSSGENILPLLSPINYSPYILPPIAPSHQKRQQPKVSSMTSVLGFWVPNFHNVNIMTRSPRFRKLRRELPYLEGNASL